MSNVLVVGGAGLLGYHTTLELVARGHRVTSLSLPPAATDVTFPEGVGTLWADVTTMTDDELAALLDGVDAVMYAAGAGHGRATEHDDSPVRRVSEHLPDGAEIALPNQPPARGGQDAVRAPIASV